MQFQKDFLDKLKSAKHVVVLTGAGMSAESGIKTFRDSNGLWNNHRIEDVACKTGLEKNPKLVWDFYQQRVNDILTSEPNPGHIALAELESMVPSLTIITQNVDGLHRHAGNTQIIELHGTLYKWHCESCKKEYDVDDVIVESMKEGCEYGVCNSTTFPFVRTMTPNSTETICGGYIRPSVVWFDEYVQGLDKIESALQDCDMMLIIGTSAEVSPASHIPSIAKSHNNAYICIVNPSMTWLDKNADCVIYGKAGEVLPEIVSRIKNATSN